MQSGPWEGQASVKEHLILGDAAIVFWLCSRDLAHTSSSRIFLRELENYTDCPELVGRCFLERVRASQTCPSAGLTP